MTSSSTNRKPFTEAYGCLTPPPPSSRPLHSVISPIQPVHSVSQAETSRYSGSLGEITPEADAINAYSVQEMKQLVLSSSQKLREDYEQFESVLPHSIADMQREDLNVLRNLVSCGIAGQTRLADYMLSLAGNWRGVLNYRGTLFRVANRHTVMANGSMDSFACPAAANKRRLASFRKSSSSSSVKELFLIAAASIEIIEDAAWYLDKSPLISKWRIALPVLDETEVVLKKYKDRIYQLVEFVNEQEERMHKQETEINGLKTQLWKAQSAVQDFKMSLFTATSPSESEEASALPEPQEQNDRILIEKLIVPASGSMDSDSTSASPAIPAVDVPSLSLVQRQNDAIQTSKKYQLQCFTTMNLQIRQRTAEQQRGLARAYCIGDKLQYGDRVWCRLNGSHKFMHLRLTLAQLLHTLVYRKTPYTARVYLSPHALLQQALGHF